MKIGFSLCAFALVLSSGLSALSVRTPPVGIDVDVGTPSGYYYYGPSRGPYYYDDTTYAVWIGPGWYYGVYFDNFDDYYYWLDTRYYQVGWNGPNWYYGFWFDSENDFNHYRGGHRRWSRDELRSRDGGSRDWHSKERHGGWAKDSKQGRKWSDDKDKKK